MARPAATDEERRAQRDRLRRAAVELYREGGVPALSARAVAARAGVSTGLLYRYFDDMSALMRSIWIGPVDELGEVAADIVAAHPDPIERLEALLGALVGWVTTNPDVHRGVLLYVRPPSSTPPPAADPDELPLFRALRDAVAEGQTDGRRRAGDPAVLAQVLWAGVHGALALPVNIDTYAIAPAGQLAPLTIHALLEGLTTREEPA